MKNPIAVLAHHRLLLPRRPIHPRRWALIALAVVACAASGCTSSKYKKVRAKDAPPPAVPINASLGTEPVETTLNAVIIYKGPGSWKQEAYWDEYSVTFRNRSAVPVVIDAAALHDLAGAPHLAGNHPWALEQQSKTLEKQYADSGVAFVRYAGPVLVLGTVAVGASYVAGTAAVMGGAAGGAAAAASASVVLIPVYLGTVISLNTSRKHDIEKEFHQRRLLFPLVIKPGEERTGSLFFPMIPSPQALELTWRKSAEHGTSRLPVAVLSGLHLAPAGKSNVAQEQTVHPTPLTSQ